MADTATVTINGTLKTSSGTPLPGMTVTFTDSEGTTIASTTTGTGTNAGVFTQTATPAAPASNYTVTPAYAGNSLYGAASVTTTPVNLVAGTVMTATVTVVSVS